MLVDDKSLGEAENWVKLHNEAVPKYDTYLEEIDTRLNCKVKRPKFFITKFNARTSLGFVSGINLRVT